MNRGKFLISAATIPALAMFSKLSAKENSAQRNAKNSGKIECEISRKLDSQNRLFEIKPEGPNFEISFSALIKNGAKGEVAFHNNYAVLIDNDLASPMWWRKTGSLNGVRNIVKDFAKDGEFFDAKICVSGAQITVFINGVKVVEYIEPKNPFRIKPNNSLICQGALPVKFRLNSANGEIIFKNIKIKNLCERFDLENQQAMALDESSDAAIRLHQMDFPVLDYHVHLKGGLTVDWALARSRKLGINYAIAPNCGRDFQLNEAKKAQSFLDEAKDFPTLICMQGEGREWYKLFPQEIRDQFDFSFTDAMTFDDAAGNRTHIWKDHEVIIPEGGKQAYFDHMLKVICSVIAEPSDIYANPLWLPKALACDYDKYWTKANKSRVIDALLKAEKPAEINTVLNNIPDMEFIEMAHAKGVKFTFGSNNINPEFSPFASRNIENTHGKFDKVLDIVKKLNLSACDIYKPRLRVRS